MLYDVHTHVGLDQGFLLRGWWPYAATSQDLLQAMDAGGIDRAVVFPFTLPSAFDADAFAQGRGVRLRKGRYPFDRENTLLLDELALIDSQKRLIPFAMFDPQREVSKQVAALEKIIHRVRGLKCQSTVLQSPIKHLLGKARPIMQLAQTHNLPVLFHTSVNPSDTWAQVADCLEVAAAYPAIRFNLAHSLRFCRKGLEQAAQMPNVFVDCSAHLAHCQLARQRSPAVALGRQAVDADYRRPQQVLQAIYNLLPGKYLWGSDNPFMSWCDNSLTLRHSYQAEADVLHALPPAVRRSMGSEAPEAWLLGKRPGAKAGRRHRHV